MPEKNNQSVLSKLMKMQSDVRENVLMNTTIQNVASKILKSAENEEEKLKVNKVWVDKKRDNDDEERGTLLGSGGGNGSGNADLMDDKSFDNVGVVGSSPSVLAKRESALGKMRGCWY